MNFKALNFYILEMLLFTFASIKDQDLRTIVKSQSPEYYTHCFIMITVPYIIGGTHLYQDKLS